MFFEPIEIPDELLEAQEQGKLVVFAGAGVSMGEPSNLPSFKGLAAKIADSHPLAGEIDRYNARLDCFLGELFRRGVDVQKLCRSLIGNPASKPTELHRSLIDLFIKRECVRIVTTNFDNHFRTVLEERGWKTDCYYAPALPLGHQFSGLVYLHGWIERPEPLVLTDEDFGRAYLTEGWARAFLQRLFAEFTILFVGYSHNDIPVEYLARGMSGKSIAPRFALTAAGEAGQWASLGIREITFEKTQGPNPFENLYAGVKKWAEFTKQQPTDIAERVKAIVCAPESLALDRSQSGLLRRCLEREDSCHFFTGEAKGWRWVEWLHKQGMLAGQFGRSHTKPTKAQMDLAGWLARELLAEESDAGLLLVEKHGGAISPLLWQELLRIFLSIEEERWSDSRIQKWALILMENCPPEGWIYLSSLWRKAAKAAPQTLGMTILRRITSLCSSVKQQYDYTSFGKGGKKGANTPKAEIEIGLAGDLYELDTVWEQCIKPRLHELREPLLSLLENRLREVHELFMATGRAHENFDPYCIRGRIYERNNFRAGHDLDVVLDLLLCVLEESAQHGWSLSEPRLTGWLASGVPVLVRVGLYALHLSNEIPKPRKVELIRQHQLVHPAVSGATHEAWLVLSDCYAALDVTEKQALWQTINQGPSDKRPDDVVQEAWQEWRQRQIDRLTWFLATKNKECPEVAQVLAALQQREPEFRGYQGMDQAIYHEEAKWEGPRTPKSAIDLLSASPASQIDWLLSYKGGEEASEESRAGLLNAVGDACAQNHEWGFALLAELANRQAWKSDLWDAAFWKMNLCALPQDKLTWSLKSVESHFADFSNLQALSSFLFNNIDFSDGKRPSDDNLELLIRLSLLIWEQIKGAQSGVNQDFKNKEWLFLALNHPAGSVTGFWLNYCDHLCRKMNERKPGFPDWLRGPLADMVAGTDHASQLGRAMLAARLPLVYHMDPAWTKAQLFPKMCFSVVGEEAFLMWEPHASFGQLSRELIFSMPKIYQEAFPYFRGLGGDLQGDFFRHVAIMVYSCLFDVNEGNWFLDFFTGLDEEEKAAWAMQLGAILREAPEEQNALVWQRWMKEYWENRIHGRPCPLAEKEAGAMLEWIFVVGAAFPEAVEYLIQGPRIKHGQKPALIFHHLKNHEAPQKYPESVLKLLDWFLADHTLMGISMKDVKEVLFRLPRKKEYLLRLNNICQHLASLGCAGAAGLKRRIEQEFTEG